MGMLGVRAGAALAACWLLSGCGKGGEPAAGKASPPPAAPARPDGGPAVAAAEPTAAPEVALDAPPVLREHGTPSTANYSAGDKTTPFAHGRVELALPGVWAVQLASSGSLNATPDEIKDTSVMLDVPRPTGGKSIDVFLAARLDELGKGIEIVERSPAKIAVATSKSGVPFAAQGVRARLADGTELAFTAIAIDVGGGEAQPLFLVATTAAKLKALTKLVGPALGALTVKAPVAVAASEPPSGSAGKPQGEGGSVYQETSADDSYIWGVWSAKSPKLPAVAYDIKLNVRVDVLTPKELDVARDAAGNLYVNYSEQISDNSPISRNVFGLAAGTTKWAKTGVSHATIQGAAKKSWKQSFDVMYIGGFSLDAKGNMLVRAALYDTSWEAFFWFGKDGSTDVAVGPAYVAKLANDTDWMVSESARMNDDGSFWLFVRHEDTKFDMALVSRGADGKWGAKSWQPRFDPKYPQPDPRAIPQGNPDYKGDWTFFSNGVVWEIDRKGTSRPIARVDIAAEGVWFSGPVVLKNGDIWIAVNRIIDVQVYVKVDPSTGVTETTSGQFFVGDRSRLIRFRRNDKGGLDAAEIDGKEVLATLVKSGANVPFDTLFELGKLRLDPATGGLLGVETRNAQVLVIVPRD